MWDSVAKSSAFQLMFRVWSTTSRDDALVNDDMYVLTFGHISTCVAAITCPCLVCIPAVGVLVMTRWHPDDLAGILLREEPDVWTHVNIPAVAEASIPDALGRLPGAVMTSGWATSRYYPGGVSGNAVSFFFFFFFFFFQGNTEGVVEGNDGVDAD